jgi:hypothetical protein
MEKRKQSLSSSPSLDTEKRLANAYVLRLRNFNGELEYFTADEIEMVIQDEGLDKFVSDNKNEVSGLLDEIVEFSNPKEPDKTKFRELLRTIFPLTVKRLKGELAKNPKFQTLSNVIIAKKLYGFWCNGKNNDEGNEKERILSSLLDFMENFVLNEKSKFSSELDENLSEKQKIK